MARDVFPDISQADIKLLELVLKKGHIRHKYAVRVQAVLNLGLPSRSGLRGIAIGASAPAMLGVAA